MANSPSPPRAAGALLALSIIAGAVVGAYYGEPSAGVLIGFAIGVSFAVATWLIDRRR